MTIYVDCDGCPVVEQTIRIAKQFHEDCILICDTSHYFSREGATTITVSEGSDSVDYAIVNRVARNDIVVTQDYGLAAMCIARLAMPISQNGMVYTDDNIGALLLQRHTARKIRMAGGRLKGNSKRTNDQNIAFEKALTMLLENQQPL